MISPKTNAHLKNMPKTGSGSAPCGILGVESGASSEASAMKRASGAVLGTMTSVTTPKRATILPKIAKA